MARNPRDRSMRFEVAAQFERPALLFPGGSMMTRVPMPVQHSQGPSMLIPENLKLYLDMNFK